MNWDDVYLVSENLNTATDAEVDELEKALNCSTPQDYRKFVTHFGNGEYCDFVRVLMPSVVRKYTQNFWERWEEFYQQIFGRGLLSKETILESILFADTKDGDEFIFHPSNPAKIYILPRHNDTIFITGTSLSEMLDWLLYSGEMIEPVSDTFRYFTSYHNRASVRLLLPKHSTTIFDEARRKLLAVNKHDVVIAGDASHITIFVKAFYGKICLTSYINSNFDDVQIFYDVDKGFKNPLLPHYINTLIDAGFHTHSINDSKEMQEWLMQQLNNVR